jgi:DNA polymerase III delta prime subunit
MTLEAIGEGILRVNGIEVRYMVPASLVLRKSLKFVDVFELIPFITKMSQVPTGSGTWDPPNLLLNGPKGTGKSLLASYLAETLGIPYLSMDCSEETRERHFKGGFIAKSGETPFILGTVANAIKVANECGFAMLVLEELNSLPNQQQKLVNSFTDFRRKLEIPELSTRLELSPTAKLWVIATQNPTVYGGTNELNDDLRSRFTCIDIPYPPPEAEKEILMEMTGYGKTGSMGDPIQQQGLEMLVNIANQTRQGATSYSLSTRDLVELINLLPRVGWFDMMFLLCQKFGDEDRKLVIERIQDITKNGTHADLAARVGLT